MRKPNRAFLCLVKSSAIENSNHSLFFLFCAVFNTEGVIEVDAAARYAVLRRHTWENESPGCNPEPRPGKSAGFAFYLPWHWRTRGPI